MYCKVTVSLHAVYISKNTEIFSAVTSEPSNKFIPAATWYVQLELHWGTDREQFSFWIKAMQNALPANAERYFQS